jgi:RNA polymerase sigma-54 factor
MLGRHSLENIARDVGVSVEEVSEALQFVRENLNPFPAHASWASPRRGAPEDKVAYPQPDVIIRESKAKKGEYEIELPRARGLGLRVGTSYRQAMGRLGVDDASANGQGWKRWEEFRARARLFVSSVEQRWRTLYDMMCILVDCQRDFLSHGERRLNPLTRARVAEMMGVHESTVSRAVADKYVELPTGKVVPLKKFFDSAAPVRQAIQRLVDRESEPLSDSAIARRLRQQGYDVARRTVAKYRNALGILPYSLRRRKKDLSPDRP